jgi:endoribonuclease Dicer
LRQKIIDSHRVMVTTSQVLLDLLRHEYINLGADISLLVFDECHHTEKNHPYNAIMKDFYHILPPRGSPTASEYCVRPMVLGLTASPIFGGPDQAFRYVPSLPSFEICGLMYWI